MADKPLDILDAIALFNTIIGLTNVQKNDEQYAHQKMVDDKVDLILAKLDLILTKMERS